MAIETLDDIAEEMADRIGIYSEPRCHFVPELKDRVRAAVAVERTLEAQRRTDSGGGEHERST